MIHPEKKIAVLIDAENTQQSALVAIITELSKYGYLIVKRAYGDWSSSMLKSWKTPMNELAIQPIQQFAYTSGKNSSDAAMIIDAMDLLYSERFNAFALISSDSDFTKLATRLKESHIYVYGVGERKTPIAFRNACDDFIYIDVLKTLDMDTEKTDSLKTEELKQTTEKQNQLSRQQLCQNTTLMNMLRNAANECSNEEGWAELGVCGSLIKRQHPDFDSRNFGYAKLSTLIETTTLFEMKKIAMKGTNAFKLFYRDKKKK
ncbi:MAG: NYN domain-containing protein [Methylobacter tundripaludum]|nr:NYN domain-containing protein [Methylobacter tundripaludum]